jgi:anti-anti-sigma factor
MPSKPAAAEESCTMGHSEALRFRLKGEVDISVAGELLAGFLDAIHSDGQSATVEIDCSALEFIDSSGLRMLDTLQTSTGRQVVLVDVPKRFRRVFEISGMDQVFELRSDG